MKNSEIYPMTAFEEYMYLDSSAGYPMDCYFRLHFRGRLEHSVVEAALQEVIGEHPFLRARCLEWKKKRYAWQIPERSGVVSGDPVSLVDGVAIHWVVGPCRGKYPREMNLSLDLEKEPPLRLVFVEEKSETGEVIATDCIMKIHHAAVDAIGSVRFLEDFFRSYARRQGTFLEAWKEISPVDGKLLPQRRRYGKTVWQWCKIWGTTLIRLRRCLVFVFRKILPLAKRPSPEAVRQVAEDYPAMIHRSLSKEETKEWLAGCRGKRYTMNDILLHASYLTLRDWRQAHPEAAFEGKERPFRIAVPTNLRHVGVQNYPAVNQVSMVFLDRKISEIHASEAFLKKIHREMQDVKRLNLGFLLVAGTILVRAVMGNLKSILGFSECWTTMVLTNVGRIWEEQSFSFPRTDEGKLILGEAILEAVESAPPIRPLTAVAVCVTTYAGEMGLTLHYDSRSMNRGLAEDFMDKFQKNVRILLGMEK